MSTNTTTKGNNLKSKQDYIQYLVEAANDKRVKENKNLLERLSYAFRKTDSAALSDLRSLATEVKKLLGAQRVEAALKPPAKNKKEVEKQPEAKKPAAKEEPKTEKKTKAKAPPKAKEEKSIVETIPGTTNKGADKYLVAALFPKEIATEEYGKLLRQETATYDEIVARVNEGKYVVLAVFWNKRQIKEFAYAETFGVTVPKTGFPLDLDLQIALFSCDTIQRIFAKSHYTEAVTRFDAEHFEPVAEIDPRKENGEEFRVRISSGAEFEVYYPENDEEAE